MSLPNVEDLENVTELLEEIESLKAKVSSLEKELERTEAEYKAKEKSEYHKILEKTRSSIDLEKVQEEIGQIRKEEVSLRETLETKISEAVESYFSSDAIDKFKKDLLARLEKQGKVEKEEKDGNVRYILDNKSYILDPESLKKELKVKLMYELLPTE